MSSANTYRIVGIDPGTNNIGFCCFIIDAVTLKLLRVETVNIDVSKTDKTPKGVIPYNDKVQMRLNALDRALEILFIKYKPIAMSVEDVYINKFRPAAVSPLAKAVRTIEMSFKRVAGGYVRSVNPMTAKKRIRVIRPKKIKGKKIDNKLIVTEALHRSRLSEYTVKKIDDMSEHEQDALIICLELYQVFLSSGILQLQLLTDRKIGEFVSDYIYTPYSGNMVR